MFRPILIVALLLISETLSQYCPSDIPAEAFEPCECYDYGRLSCQSPLKIKEYFDRLGPLVDSDFVFPQLYLALTNQSEFPADSIQTTKFKEIFIEYNGGLEFIHADAFTGNYDVTTKLKFESNSNLWLNRTPQDFYNLVNNFTKLEVLQVNLEQSGSPPDNAFQLPELKELVITGHLPSVSSRLFAGLPKLETLDLGGKGLEDGDFADDAFEGISKDAGVDLRFNVFWDMPEKIFKPLLDNAKLVWIGGSQCPVFQCYYKRLMCNSQVDWICKNRTEYQPKFSGFKCYLSKYEDLWEYCDDNFGKM